MKPTTNPSEHRLTTNDITVGDVLRVVHPDDEEDTRKPVCYVVRMVWETPLPRGNRTYPVFQRDGFTLFESSSCTDREVSVIELQKQFDKGVLVPHRPQTVRLVKGLTPRDYHKQNGTIRKAA